MTEILKGILSSDLPTVDPEERAVYLLNKLDARLRLNMRSWFDLYDSIRFDIELVQDQCEDDVLLAITTMLMRALNDCPSLEMEASWDDLVWILKAGIWFHENSCVMK